MSRAKQTSDVEDMTNYPRICRADRSVRDGREVDHKFISLIWTERQKDGRNIGRLL
jgi:hypothetical protein